MTDQPITHSLRVRAMTQDDLEQVLVIDQASFSLPWPSSAYRYELFDNESSLCRVAELLLPEGKPVIVGLIVIWLILDEAHIATIATHPDYRGHGIARKLLAESLRDCLDQGAQNATLEVREHNEVAQNLYQQFGFTVVGRRTHYYRDNQEDALLMTLAELNQENLTRLSQPNGNGPAS